MVKDGIFHSQDSEVEIPVVRPPRLFEIAYACRLYAEFTEYDEALDELQEMTGRKLDLTNSAHRKALLRWLNAWGCRQFAIEHHPDASRALEAWAGRCLPLLPPPDAALAELTAHDLDDATRAYEDLAQARASVRQRGRKEYPVSFGPTGAAKTLYALRPEVFPPWDEPIREALGLDGSGESYRRFLESVQLAIQSLISEAREHGIHPQDIPRAISRPGSSLPKLMDEFYWVTIRNGVRLPTPADIAMWHAWAHQMS